MSDFTPQQLTQIQNLIDQRIGQNLFHLPKVPPHKHDGVDNIHINERDIVGTRINSGNVSFAQQTTYTLGVNFPPKSIWFYGIAVDNEGSPTIRVHIVGNALLQGAYYMSPASTTSTGVSTQIQSIAQSSSYLWVQNGGTFHALSSVGTHIIDVIVGGTIYARATIQSVTGNGIVMTVDDLASGWQINGNFVIT